MNFIITKIIYVAIGKAQDKELFQGEKLLKIMEEKKEDYDKLRKKVQEIAECEDYE